MSALTQVIGWPLGLFCAAMAAWRLARMAFVPKHSRTGKRLWSDAMGAHAWVTFLLWSAAAVAVFTILGRIVPLAGWLYAGIAAAIVLVSGRAWTPAGRHGLRGQVTRGLNPAVGDARRARGWLARLWARFRGGDVTGDEPGADVEAAVRTRGVPVPSVRDDDTLGPPPPPDVIASVPVPAGRSSLAAAIAEFRPENAGEEIAFLRGHAAGYLAEAHAWRTHADGCLNEIGLDPAFAHAVAEGGDEVSEMAHVFSLVERRLMVIYGAIMEAVDGGLIMPHDGRWFSEGEAA